jgi:UDP-GlcNAc:undecaprenyl-phosphate/decaprenyl-phosphate GlcNAc-1-phosphate transferase
MENLGLIQKCLEIFSIQVDYLKNLLPENFAPYVDFVPLFFLSALFAFVITPIIGFFAQKYDVLDYPAQFRLKKRKVNKHDKNERHIHKKPTPLLGGLSFILPIILILLLFLNLSVAIKAMLAGALVLVIVGILDDIYNLPASYQFAGQIVAALIIAFSPINMSVLTIPLDGVLDLDWFAIGAFIFPGDLLMVIWILACINAFKFLNGSDGLMEGNAIIICLLFFILGMRTDAEMIILLSIVLAGGLSGFLFYNYPPAKIFSGAAGTTTLGFLIAIIAILNNTKFAASIMILTLPIIDFIFVVTKRYFVHKPKNFGALMKINDTSHLHHQFISLGFSPKKILLVEISLTLLIGLIAILTTGAINFFFLVLIIFLTILGILALHIFSGKRKLPPESKKESPESRYSY